MAPLSGAFCLLVALQGAAREPGPPIDIQAAEFGVIQVQVNNPDVEYVELRRLVFAGIGDELVASSEFHYLIPEQLEEASADMMLIALPKVGEAAAIEVPITSTLTAGAYCERIEATFFAENHPYTYVDTGCFELDGLGGSNRLQGEDFLRLQPTALALDREGREVRLRIGGGEPLTERELEAAKHEVPAKAVRVDDESAPDRANPKSLSKEVAQ